MGNFIVSIAHFCELHGPSIVMCTQAFDLKCATSVATNNKPTSSGNSSTCLSCKLVLPESESTGHNKQDSVAIRTVDDEARYEYISKQFPSSQTRYSILRQVVMRCLSVETSYDDLRPIMFGDSTLGYSIAMVFKVKDSTARGSERKYALIITGEDEGELMHSWNLIVLNLKTMIKMIKSRMNELESRSNSNDSLADNNERFYRRTLPKPKSLTELLDDQKLFVKLHLWAVYLLNHLR